MVFENRHFFLLGLLVTACGEQNGSITSLETSSKVSGRIEFIVENNQPLISILEIGDAEFDDPTIDCPVGMEIETIPYEYQGGEPETLLFDNEPVTRISKPDSVIAVDGVPDEVFGLWAFAADTTNQEVQFAFSTEITSDRLTFINDCTL